VHAESKLQYAQQVGKFYLGVVHMSDRKQNRETDTWIGEANAVLHELYCFVVTKLEFSNTTSCQFFNHFLFQSSPMAVNLW